LILADPSGSFGFRVVDHRPFAMSVLQTPGRARSID
jgi:hypothetical protein